ncbi:MAG TPA: SpaA isopeptide-forming pilin-related protein [Beutenbergiaceae bacterium]|nr:SpaA isopeptide-forming pilin-related protein [Beutenbergiaceae bacterium]
MTRSQHAQRHWRRKVLGVGLTASLLLVGPTAVWADGDEHLEQPEEISEPVTDLELGDGETGPAEGPTGDVPAEPGDDAIARGEDAQQSENTDAEETADRGQGSDSEPENRERRAFSDEGAGVVPLATGGEFAFSCEPGAVYGVSANGYIREVTPGATSASNFGGQATMPGWLNVPVSSFNGLGIGPGGDVAYAYERSSGAGSATLYEFDSATGEWSRIMRTSAQPHVATTRGNGPGSIAFVAGAVDPVTENFYLGGFGTYQEWGTGPGGRPTYTTYRFFSIWEYNPNTNALVYKGYVDDLDSSGEANGDMAFTSLGDLLIVRGDGTSTQTISVSYSNLQNASGGAIASAQSSVISGTLNDVNGVAFDSAGKGYLGSDGGLTSYDTPSWDNANELVSSGFNSTDLATCSTPPTVRVTKKVEGRVNDTDQFTIVVGQGDVELGRQTTTGQDLDGEEEGVEAVIGPLPAVLDRPIDFFEEAVGTSDLDKYATSWRCWVDGAQSPRDSGEGTRGQISLELGDENAVCEIVNSPLVAEVEIVKSMVSADGSGTPVVEEGWLVGASATGGTLDGPAAQETDETGAATWSVDFADKNATADLSVHEVMQDGYSLHAASCEVSHLDGTTTQIPLGATSGNVDGVKPGDDVRCDFINKPGPASLIVEKEWVVNSGAGLPHGDAALPEGLEAQLVVQGEDREWGEEHEEFHFGQAISISEVAGLGENAPEGCALGAEDPTITPDGGDPSPLTDSGTEVTLNAGVNGYTITNYVDCTQRLTLIKEVNNNFGEGDEYGPDQLNPRDWSLAAADWTLIAEGEETYSFSSGATQEVREGVYELSETHHDGYEQTSLVCDAPGFDDAAASVEVGLGQAVECTFVNKITPGSVEWLKIDDSGNGNALSGSVWELEGPGGESVEISDEDNGRFQVIGLEWGQYTLTETTAPAGYQLLEQPIEFEIAEGDELDLVLDAIENTQRDVPDLPLTGGIGRDHLYIAGALTALLGMAAYVYTTRRRQA